MSEKVILVWFRNDLRVHDNEILLEATRKADKVLPVYCFDPYYFKSMANGTLKTGSLRTRFLLESVADLRQNLQHLGGDLIIRIGNPAEILPQLVTEFQVTEVYHHREVAAEETGISEQVETALWKLKINLKHFIGHTLYHKEDLPFPIKDIPDSFATFRKKVERESTVRPCLATPEYVMTPAITDAGELHSLEDLGLAEPIADERALRFYGGETAGLQQLEVYLNRDVPVSSKAKAAAVTSRLSPWLALGCLSLRQVYWAIVGHEQTSGSYPLMLELFWRDYFRFMFKKHGSRFSENIIADAAIDSKQQKLLDNWRNGNTGIPYIDAVMHELKAGGYIGGPARQLAAVYLVQELKLDWKLGAAWFEHQLLDYSPASNWGNWASVAGEGIDQRDNRIYNISKMAKDFDPKGEYTKRWSSQVGEGQHVQEV